MSGDGTRSRWAWVAVCMFLVSLPFLAVDFVPSTDLPQHLGQLRLFGEAMSDPSAPLEIQWWTPYSLVYALMALPWAFLEPVAAGRMAVLLLLFVQLAVTHWVAWRFDRPVAAVVLAAAFFFSSPLYWGFLNFHLGWAAFLVWFVITRRSPVTERGWRTVLIFFAGAVLLYCSHALWFACGLLWFWVEALVSRRSLRDLGWRFSGQVPVIAAALFWYGFLKESGFGEGSAWGLSPLARLSPKFLVLSGLGGLRHPIEVLIVGTAILWLVASLVANRRRRLLGCDPYLLAMAGLLLAIYLVAPDKHLNSILFSARWLPFVFISALLAVGRLPLRPTLQALVPISLLATHMVVTAAFWKQFEVRELSGLARSLEVLPDEPRVIGFSYAGLSTPYLMGRPHVQLFAWAQAVHGGELNFSFGHISPSLVVYSDRAERIRWTWGLEWLPKSLRRSDLRFFDYALIGGSAEDHARAASLPELVPVVHQGVWRLYRTSIGPDTPPAPPMPAVAGRPSAP